MTSATTCTVRRAAASPFDAYLVRLKDEQLLSPGEERSLADAIAAGDAAARDHMVRSNLRLVIRIARDYANRGMDMEDLVGEGNLGLIRAAEDFDPSFGVRFSTYASYWIKQAIRHALANTTATIRLPAHMVTILSKWRKAERTLARELNETPSFDQVAATLGLTDAQRTLVMRAKVAGGLKIEGGGEEGRSVEEASDRHAGPYALVATNDDCRDLRQRMGRLDDREREIVSLRFGLNGEGPLTLKEVGQRIGVTREWVRKIEVRAVAKLGQEDPSPGTPPNRPRRPRRPTMHRCSTHPVSTSRKPE